jgi:DNA invertase Pin-like site-specific DNA recombinase
MRYVIYTRVSTKKQTVENQLHACREYIYKIRGKGDEIIEFSEPDKSTMKPITQRKILVKMMESLRSGDRLIVYKVDRLAREPKELVNIYCDLVDRGIDIRGVADADLDKGKICIYAFIAYQERKNIQERTKDGLKRKSCNGERIGTLKYGYSLDPTTTQAVRKDVHSYGKPYLLIPEENEQKQVSLMEEMYRQGMSYGEIVRELDARGFRNRAGNPVQKMTVHRILKRLGKLRPAPMAELYAMSH